MSRAFNWIHLYTIHRRASSMSRKMTSGHRMKFSFPTESARDARDEIPIGGEKTMDLPEGLT